MTQDKQIKEQECQIYKLRAERAELSARITKLQSMYRMSQNHIQTLQGIINKSRTAEAERVFK